MGIAITSLENESLNKRRHEAQLSKELVSRYSPVCNANVNRTKTMITLHQL